MTVCRGRNGRRTMVGGQRATKDCRKRARPAGACHTHGGGFLPLHATPVSNYLTLSQTAWQSIR